MGAQAASVTPDVVSRNSRREDMGKSQEGDGEVTANARREHDEYAPAWRERIDIASPPTHEGSDVAVAPPFARALASVSTGNDPACTALRPVLRCTPTASR